MADGQDEKRKAIYLEKVPSGGGRPKLVLTADGVHFVEVLAGFMCTDEEIADALGTTCDTLHNKNNGKAFSEAKQKGQSRGKVSLRRYQFKLAEKNATMAIFLGKNYLGQRDVTEFDSLAGDMLAKAKEVLGGIKSAVK